MLSATERSKIMEEVALLLRLLDRCEDGSQWKWRIENRIDWLRKKLEE
jgi:hypothetical protein